MIGRLQQEGFATATLCEVLEVHRSRYYAWQRGSHRLPCAGGRGVEAIDPRDLLGTQATLRGASHCSGVVVA